MIITELSLTQFFDQIIPRAKKEKFEWIISLIARYADAKAVYKNIEEDLPSLNDLTNDKILFVFSLGPRYRNNSFFHKSGEACYVGSMSPYAEMLNGKKLADKTGDFMYLVEDFYKADWKQKHSQTITEFIRKYHIPEEQLPILFSWNLKNDEYSVVPLKEDTHIYSLIRTFVITMDRYEKEEQELEKTIPNYKTVEKYFVLYDQIKEKAKQLNAAEKEAVLSVLNRKSSYLERKSEIPDPKLRSDLKRMGQWERHFFKDVPEVVRNREIYEKVLAEKSKIRLKMDRIWDEISAAGADRQTGEGSSPEAKEKAPALLEEKNVINHILSACIKLQSNAAYYDARENNRNDYIRDLLDMAGYDVRDQTRQGCSPGRKDSGEIDIQIRKGGKPLTVIEALNLDSLRKNYIDQHLDKIYDYDVSGNAYNIILSYVSAANFSDFWEKYIQHIQRHQYVYPLVETDRECEAFHMPYSDIRLIKTIHNRNGKNTSLYHICVHIPRH